jgi:ATP-dependent helicase/nuclease subunit A
MTALRHTMILASAGSGKTHALTSRFIALLAAGAAPERIVALTFTRKAAGEFFDGILTKLADAATHPPSARALAGEIGRTEWTGADFLRLLRVVVDAMPRLNLGTLDGFFARIVRSFPLELGLGGEFAILEDHAALRERRRVLRGLFTGAGDTDDARREFGEAFKRATFGAEEKQLGPRLDTFIDSHAEAFLSAPDARLWGVPDVIWPAGCPWLAAAPGLAGAARALPAALPMERFSDGQRRRIEAFVADVEQWIPGAPLTKAMDYLVDNAFAVWPELLGGHADLMLDRRAVALGAGGCAAVVAVVAGIAGAELARRLARTQGLHRVLHGYEARYDATVRRAGRLTFADLQRLLLPEAGGPRLSSSGAGAEARLAIDWRLDAQFEHWLLDEFQDTSRGQWSVLRNLIDEVIQDPEGRRTFFYVGDVKQAIFAWREGDARLFREIFDHYNGGQPGVIEEVHLTRSWRSGPAVIAMVNRVFGSPPALRAIVPEATAARWAREWRDHSAVHGDRASYAVLRHAAEADGRRSAVADILRETDALARGLSVAVLVQKNAEGTALADFLRRSGFPAVAESDLHVCTDNPLGVALLALLKAAAHPADTRAWELVRMGPLGRRLTEAGIGDVTALVPAVLGQLHREGFAATLEAWMARIDPDLADDDTFSRGRARQLVAAAHRFDESGGREVADFIDFAERHVVRDLDTGAVVRIITVHKAKGLGFDLVILPDLEGSRLAQRRGGLAIHRGPDRTVRWVLDPPPKLLMGNEPVLARQLEEDEAEAAYEALCILYVAMTRAKRAMYVVTEPVGRSQSQNFPRLLQETLGETWEEGDPSWFASVPPPPPIVPDRPAPTATAMSARIRRSARTPSGGERLELPAPLAFALESDAAASHGSAVHGLLATVEWLEPGSSPPEFAPDPEAPDAPAAARRCLLSPAFGEVFARPRVPNADVWRERSFEIVLDDAWYSGVFDRVVVERDASGRALRATVWDFKTDRVNGDAGVAAAVERHGHQLLLYRRVVACLTGLPEARVRAALALLAPGRLAEIGPDARAHGEYRRELSFTPSGPPGTS